MANLGKLAESLNVKLPENRENSQTAILIKPTGVKRRPWLNDDNNETEKNIYSPPLEKGSIDHIYKPHLSTPSINPFDQPLIDKESTKGGYKPLNISLSSLRGNPLKIAQYIFELSKEEKEKTTPKITQSEIIKFLIISRDSARTGIRFLLKNKLLSRIEFKPGKSGWSKYRLKNELYNELSEAYKKGSIDPLKKGSISSSSIYINTTTKNENENISKYGLPAEWNEIDIEPLQHIGFTTNQLKQLMADNKLTPADVQQSIYIFAFDLKENSKAKSINSSPLGYFMKILRRGEVYAPPNNYETPQDRAMRLYLEKQRELAKKRQDMEAEMLKIAFNAWLESLSAEEKEELIPSEMKKFTASHKPLLNDHFKNHLWPEKRKAILTEVFV